jgi:hypothetical protein
MSLFYVKNIVIFVICYGFIFFNSFGQDVNLKHVEKEIDFQLPLNRKLGEPLFQTKRSGSKSDLELEVDALEEIVSPADGFLIYSGPFSSSSNGFVISHDHRFVSIISSPLSFEKFQNLKFGYNIKKGQVIASMRGGNLDAKRSLNWSLYVVEDKGVIDDIKKSIANQIAVDFSLPQPLVEAIYGSRKINIKNKLELGTLQFEFPAAEKLDYCDLNLSGIKMSCLKAENYDHLLPEGMYKIDIMSGRFFKSTISRSNLISKGDTVIQDVSRDDSGNFFAGSYGVERSDDYWAAKNIINDFYAVDKVVNLLSKSEADLAERDRQDGLILAELQQSSIATTSRDKIAEESQPTADEAAQAAKLQAQRQAAEQEIAMAAEKERQQALALVEANRVKEAEENRRKAAQAAQAAQLQAQRQAELERAQAAEKERQQALALAEANRVKEAEENQRKAAQAAQAAQLQAQRQAELERSQLQRIAQLQADKKNKNIAKNNRKALIMGNDGYKDVPTLINAKSDARSMSASLNNLGFEVSTFFDLSERGMKEAIRNFKAKVNGGDEVVVYFAGHGVQLGATNYLLPVDIRGQSEDQVKDEAIPLQRLLDDLQDTKARFALAIIDACRDNPFKNSGRSIGGRGLASTSAVTGQMVMFSAGTGQQALDRLGPNDKEPNGLFTRILLREIQKPGVPIDRIVRNVRNEVARLSRSVGHEQVPAVYDQTLGDFFFNPEVK